MKQSLRRPLFALASGSALAVVTFLSWPRSYSAKSTLLLEFSGEVPKNLRGLLPEEIAKRWSEGLLDEKVFPETAKRLGRCGALSVPAQQSSCIGELVRLDSQSGVAYQLDVSATDPNRLVEKSTALSLWLVEIAPRTFGVADSPSTPASGAEETALRNLAEYVTQHPELGKLTELGAESPSEKVALWRGERRKLHEMETSIEAKLKALSETLASDTANVAPPTASANPEAPGSDSTANVPPSPGAPSAELLALRRELDGVRRRTREVDQRVADEEKLLATKTAPGVSGPVRDEWQRRVKAVHDLPLAGKSSSTTAYVAPWVKARVIAQAQAAVETSTGSRWAFACAGFALGLIAAVGLWVAGLNRRQDSKPRAPRPSDEDAPEFSNEPLLAELVEVPPPSIAAPKTERYGSDAPPSHPPVVPAIRVTKERTALARTAQGGSPGRYSYSSRAPADTRPADEHVQLLEIPGPPRVPLEVAEAIVETPPPPSEPPKTRRGWDIPSPAPAPPANDEWEVTTAVGFARLQEKSSSAPAIPRGSPQNTPPQDAPPRNTPPQKRTLQIGSTPSSDRAPDSTAPKSSRRSFPTHPPRFGEESEPQAAEMPAPLVILPIRARWSPPASSPGGLKPAFDELSSLASGRPTVVLLSASPESQRLLAETTLELAARLVSEVRGKILVIEADFEHPMVGSALGLEVPSGVGFSQQLHNHITTATFVPWTILDPGRGFHFLGESRFRSPGLLWSMQFPEAVRDVRLNYQLTLIVAPGHMNEVDKRALDDVTDAALVVVDTRIQRPTAPLQTGLLADKVRRTILISPAGRDGAAGRP